MQKMCDSDRDVQSHGMLALRMKQSPLSLFPNALHNEANLSATSSAGQAVPAISPVFTFPPPGNCFGPSGGQTVASQVNQAALAEYHRIQLYDYAAQATARLRLNHPAFAANSTTYNLTPAYAHPAFGDGALAAITPFARFDPRFRFIHEEPKPQHSYIGLIAMAILSSPEQKMVLSDIYQYILDNYPYFRNRGPGWRNSIRHNLSLNDCFIKAGRSANGKGHYWAIHPANIDDFKKGDFRRRKAQRKVRKHMGLSVPDEDDSPSPTPPPNFTPTSQAVAASSDSSGFSQPLLINSNNRLPNICANANFLNDLRLGLQNRKLFCQAPLGAQRQESAIFSTASSPVRISKRQFDVESLLAPDCDSTVEDVGTNYEATKGDKQANEVKYEIEEEARRTPSLSPQADYTVNKADSVDSNASSSISVSSNAEKRSPPTPTTLATTIPFSPAITTWQAAQIQSLQSLHQLNAAGLISQSLRVTGNGALTANMPWAMSVANAQAAAATLLNYANSHAFDSNHEIRK